MSVVQLKSTVISNRDAAPTVLTNPATSGGRLEEAQGFVTTGAADSIGSVYTLLSLPSNARVSSLLLQCEALGAGCTANVGVYQNTANGGAAINATFFASALDVHAALSPTDIVNQAGNNNLSLQEMPLWQALGLASDPGTSFDISVALAAATAAAGRIGLKARVVK